MKSQSGGVDGETAPPTGGGAITSVVVNRGVSQSGAIHRTLPYNEFAGLFFQGAKARAELNHHQLRIPGNPSNTLRT